MHFVSFIFFFPGVIFFQATLYCKALIEVLLLLLSFPKDLKAKKLIRSIAVVLRLGFSLLLPFFSRFFVCFF